MEDFKTWLISWYDGIPSEDGYYLVALSDNTITDRKFDVDYCRQAAKSDGGGREWLTYYPHNVIKWAELPKNVEVTPC